MSSLFKEICFAHNQDNSPEAEEIRSFAKQQFQKRLKRIERAREQTLEQIYQTADIDEETA